MYASLRDEEEDIVSKRGADKESLVSGCRTAVLSFQEHPIRLRILMNGNIALFMLSVTVLLSSRTRLWFNLERNGLLKEASAYST